ncbi:MAG: UPF0175 family protein [Thermoplasmata archaeon]
MEIDALVESGYYSSRSDVAKDAFRTLFERKANLRIAGAVQLYNKGDISLGRAAEIASVTIEEFKDILKERNIKIEIDTSDIDEGAKEILED